MNHQLKISHPDNDYPKIEVLGSYYMLEDIPYHFVDRTRHVVLSMTDIINMFEKRIEELEKK